MNYVIYYVSMYVSIYFSNVLYDYVLRTPQTQYFQIALKEVLFLCVSTSLLDS